MKKSINKKIRNLRSRVHYYALSPVRFSLNRLHALQLKESEFQGFLFENLRNNLKDIHADQYLFSRTVFEEISQFKARLTTIERWLYVISFAIIVELFLLIVLMFI